MFFSTSSHLPPRFLLLNVSTVLGSHSYSHLMVGSRNKYLQLAFLS